MSAEKQERLSTEQAHRFRVRLALEVAGHQRSFDHWKKVGHRLSIAQSRGNLEFAQAALERFNSVYQPSEADRAALAGELMVFAGVPVPKAPPAATDPKAPTPPVVVNEASKANPSTP